MSLYGTGRSEGVAAVLLIGTITVLVRAIGCWCAGVPADNEQLLAAGLPAVGGMLCYRFLRAQGRSRYAAFLAGTAYAVSPWLSALGLEPREQVAAALAPLALEAVSHCTRPARRAAWLPRAWACIAAPLAAGVTIIGVLVFAVCAAVLARTIACGDRDDDHPPARDLLLAGAAALLAAANLAWLEPLAPWLGDSMPLAAAAVLSAHRPDDVGLDVAAVLRVPGPTLLAFALLGLLRRQRHVRGTAWWPTALLGGVPSLLASVPILQAATTAWIAHPQLAATAWWLTLVAVTVLGAAGLDDFLELPLRRRTALPWLLAVAVACAPLLPVLGARVPDREWPLTATFVALPLLLTCWRRIGFLRFKNWLAVMVMVTLAIPLVQVAPVIVPLPAVPPGAPLGELARMPDEPWYAPWTGPAWRYAGLCGAFVVGCVLAVSAWRRNRHASNRPRPANAAITRKARPSQR